MDCQSAVHVGAANGSLQSFAKCDGDTNAYSKEHCDVDAGGEAQSGNKRGAGHKRLRPRECPNANYLI